ncbi:MAG TPA: efflux RND transporter periplasmic adaptor subunit, partial [Azonexus sp.]|nr:efflux RND transporter periplasmic adaptor subunit [Azonexus sp.]
AYYAYNANRTPTGAPAVAGGGAGGMAMAVEVARVKASDFADDAAAVGTLKSNESVVLRPEVAGRVSAIGFKDGAVVGKGDLLLALDAAIQEAELQQAKANLSLARSNHQRNVELLGRKFLSQQAVDSSAATLRVQEAAVQLAEAKVAKTRVKAPFRGVVGLRNVSVGDYVKEGQDLINIEDIATLRADFKLPESYLGRLNKGQIIEVTSDALPGERFKAVLDAVDPLVDPVGRSISARARLDNAAGKLRPGMFVRVRLLFGERKAVLLVPEQAVVPGAQPAVYRVVDGKATLLKVRLGVRRAAQVEVVEGLAEGDVVITAGQLKLREGVPVRAVGEGAAPGPVATDKPAAGSGAAAGK